MNDTTWQETLEEADVPVEGDPLSVYRAFDQVADGRHKRGVGYSVALILTLIVLARIGRDDDAIGHCGMGALASRVAAQGVAGDTEGLSVRVDLQ
jgi:hypothetical protein